MSKLVLGIFIGVGTIITSLGVLIGMNYYENQNDCSLNVVSYMPFVECVTTYFSDYDGFGRATIEKPLILLYPEREIPVRVQLEYAPGLFAEYPKYNPQIQGWEGIVSPESIFTPRGLEYPTYGIFWEGNVTNHVWDMSDGFIIRGDEVRDFLEEKLHTIGLNVKERSDFIMYWYPRLQDYKYVHIRFAGEDYTSRARLSITPKPDSILRVFMIAKPITKPFFLPEQKIETFNRNGFVVVEWGGILIR